MSPRATYKFTGANVCRTILRESVNGCVVETTRSLPPPIGRSNSHHQRVGRLIEQDPALKLARGRVDLEVRGGGVCVAEASLER